MPTTKISCSNLMVLAARLLVMVAFFALVNGQMPYETNEDKRNFDRDFMHFGKRSLTPVELERHFMNFGKREDDFGRQFMPFGKRYVPLQDALQYDKKNFGREFLPFGKRAPSPNGFERDFMTFGKRSSPNGFERDFMAFGRRK